MALRLHVFFEQVQQISRKVGLDQKSNITEARRDQIPRLLVFSVDHKNDPGAESDSSQVCRELQSGGQRLAGVCNNDFIGRLANFIKGRGQVVSRLSHFVAGRKQEIEYLFAEMPVWLDDQNSLATGCFHFIPRQPRSYVTAIDGHGCTYTLYDSHWYIFTFE